MNRSFLLPLSTTLFSLFSFTLNAQAIRGYVKNIHGETVPYAALQLIKKNADKDSTIIQSQLSTEAGSFEFKAIKPGKYKIKISQLQYNTLLTTIFSIASKDTTFTIQLQENTQQLNEVTIQANKSIIEQDNGKIVFNVEKSILSTGSMVMDLIKRIPGVTIDDNGISLGGKDKVMVMINGSPTYMSGQQLSSYLSNLSSNQVTQIEVNRNPSARYDAAGNAGIIDIKLKKNTVSGYSGNIVLAEGTGRYLKQNAGLSLGYKKDKLTIQTNYDYQNSKDYYDLTLNRFSHTNRGEYTLNQYTYFQKPLQSHTVKFSAESALGKNSRISLAANGQFSKEESNGYSTSDLLSNTITMKNIATTDWKRLTDKNYSAIMNLVHKFNKSGTKLSGVELNFDIALAKINSNSLQRFLSDQFSVDTYSLNGIGSFASKMPNNVNILSSRIDLLVPGKYGKTEMGIKASNVQNNSEVGYINEATHGSNSISSLNRKFSYLEQILSAYLNYQTSIKKYSIIAGLRFESTYYKAQEYILDSINANRYNKLFPTLSIKRTLGSDNALSLNYSRRIDRPDYQNLYPYTFFQDPLTSVRGNAYLLPQLSDNLSLVYSLLKGKLNFTTTYSNTSQPMVTLLRLDDRTQIVRSMMENVRGYKQLAFETAGSTNITSYWSTQNSVSIFNNRYMGIPAEMNVQNSIVSYLGSSNHTFRFSNLFSAEVALMYQSKVNRGSSVQQPTWMATSGLQYLLGKQKEYSLKLTVQDIFRSYYFYRTFNYTTMDREYRRRNDNRIIRISFTYSFSKGSTLSKSQNKKSSLDEVQKRAGVSR